MLLYGASPARDGTAAVGARLRNLYRRFGVQPSAAGVDLVSIALAVTAADTFVLRRKADNGWSRRLDVELPLCAPDIWEEVRADLERLLSFLSGDSWRFGFRPGGEAPPPMEAVRGDERTVDLSAGEPVSLFSGGLDSTVSALSLLGEGRTPILVSHAYAGDAAIQRTVAAALPKRLEHISVNARPTSALATEISMRTRSFLFIAIAALVCDVRSARRGGGRVELRVAENGFMSINAPLTPRRIGSLSTRTTHPYFLGLLQEVLVTAGLPARICNPFRFRTKGETIASVGAYPDFAGLAARTVSCARWKRFRMQCGHCVPWTPASSSIRPEAAGQRASANAASCSDRRMRSKASPRLTGASSRAGDRPPPGPPARAARPCLPSNAPGAWTLPGTAFSFAVPLR